MYPEKIYIIKVIIFSLSILPFLLELFAFINVLRYRTFASNISKNANDFFRSIKLRYTNSAKLDISIRSTKSFVEKSLLGKEGVIKYIFILDRITLFLVSINLIAVTIFAVMGEAHFSYIIFILSLCFYIFKQGCSIDAHIQFIASMIVEHLENTLYHKTKPSKERAALKLMPITDNEPKQSLNNSESLPNNAPSTKKTNEYYTHSDATPAATNHIIESILQEFLS